MHFSALSISENGFCVFQASFTTKFHLKEDARFEVSMALKIQVVFWIVTPCTLQGATTQKPRLASERSLSQKLFNPSSMYYILTCQSNTG
jgi:hypothetical protein